MKIGIDARAAKWYRGTGIGTYSYQLINSLNNIDNNNDYILYMPQNCDFNIDFNKNFKVQNVKEENRTNFWNEVNVRNVSLNTDLDLYHVPQNGIGLPQNKKCPYIITLHDVIPLRMPETVSNQYLKVFNEEMPKIISRCDGIITVSEYSKEDIISAFNFPREKIFVTYLASEPIYKPLDKKLCKSIIQKIYGISNDFILYIGGYSPRKNILGLIEAFSLLVPKIGNDIKLVIAGTKGISYNIYKNRVAELNLHDKVIFTGFISMDHIPYLYNASSLFVYPSFYEGFGLPPIEAMACGVPVIASKTTSIPEIVQDSALLINPYDIDDLYSKMYAVLTNRDLQKSLIRKGFNRASALSWTKTSKDTLYAYTQITKIQQVGNHTIPTYCIAFL